MEEQSLELWMGAGRVGVVPEVVCQGGSVGARNQRTFSVPLWCGRFSARS